MTSFLINELRKNKNNKEVKKICSMNENTTANKRPDIELIGKING
jgi:hypothetical protein